MRCTLAYRRIKLQRTGSGDVVKKEIKMNQILEEFTNIGIIPVIALHHVEDAKPLAKALNDGGLPCAEVTFRTDAAEEAIRIMAREFPDMLIGAGTVLTTGQVDDAVAAGAKFIVSPGFNPKVVSYCVEKQIPIIPGCSNPSDIEAAIELGLTAVKFFPAEASGGLSAIQALAAPYHKIKFMPTGGINGKNMKSYLDCKKIIACGGSWMVKGDMIENKDWTGIEKLTRETVSDMLGFTLKHIGIHAEDEEAARILALKFAALFGSDVREGRHSVFAGPWVELMKRPGRGTHGHLAVGVNYVERAVYHLKRKGFAFEESSKVCQEDGSLKAIYFKDEIGGFAVHLVQNQEE